MSSRGTKDRRVAPRKEDPPKSPLTREDMRAELERIARESRNDAARISAIRQLREMKAEDEANGDLQPAEGFDALDELEPRRRAKAA